MTPLDPPTAPEETGADAPRSGCRGLPPLTARLEAWMRELLADPARCSAMLATYGSPVNVHEFSALARNAEELARVADRHGVAMKIFVARKANKTFGLVDAARREGLCIDVGSYRELQQVLDLGIPSERVVVTAAVKPAELLELACDSRSLLVLDNLDEAAALQQVARTRRSATLQPTALRLAVTPTDGIRPTRFGESAAVWRRWAECEGADRLAEAGMRLDGVHFHLHGYAPRHRVLGIIEALELVDALRAEGHDLRFLDIGGGIPMSYLDDASEWDAFWQAHEHQGDQAKPLTWRGEALRQVYPYHQAPVRGAWLEEVLSARMPSGATVAEALRERSVELRCEPGRALLDGCGLTLSRVAHRSSTNEGTALIALEMNRTQCRSTSDDFLVDPLLVPAGGRPSDAVEAFLVGAYCIEDELLSRRRLAFPRGVAIGDVVAFPNTAGYLMHILESASHQIPLASNIDISSGEERRDGVDAVLPIGP